MSYISISPSQKRIALIIVMLICASASFAVAADALAYNGAPAASVAAPAPQEAGDDPESYLPYLFAVYAITWAAFFAYIFLMSRKQREMQRELTALRAALQDKNKLVK